MPGRNSGTFSTGYARIEKVRKSKSPVARVARQLAYSPLVAMSVTSAVMRRSLSAGMRTPTFNVFTKSSRRSTAEIQAWPCASLSRPPTQIGAHARSQLRHLFDRVRPDREGAQIEIASGPGCTPARILALGGDERDLGGNATIAERGNAHPDAITDLQRLHQVLAQVEVDPQVVEINQSHQRYARRHVFSGFHVALVDLRGDRRVDHHLVDNGLHGFDVGDCFPDIGLSDLPLLFRITIDRLLIGRSCLIDDALTFVQGIGRLVEAGNRSIAVLGQLLDTVIRLLRQHDVGLGPLEGG